jgi:hypothetical protein
MTRAHRLSAFLVALAAVTACEARIDAPTGYVGQPPLSIQAADYNLVAVNDTQLPRSTTNSGTVYTMVSGSFSLHADSTWFFSTLETLSAASNGQFISTSPASYQGKWTVTDTTIHFETARGTGRLKGDTLIWRNGPRHTWEDSIKFTLVRK